MSTQTNNNNILELAQIKGALEDRRLGVVAKKTGLSFPTVSRLANGEEDNYTLATLRAISKYIRDTNNNNMI